MKLVRHPNIVQLYEVIIQHKFPLLYGIKQSLFFTAVMFNPAIVSAKDNGEQIEDISCA
jgi:hypothetical protein